MQSMSDKVSVTVAAVIERDGRFLLVEEETDNGVRLNQPAGHLEPDESIVAGAARETLEETRLPLRAARRWWASIAGAIRRAA